MTGDAPLTDEELAGMEPLTDEELAEMIARCEHPSTWDREWTVAAAFRQYRTDVPRLVTDLRASRAEGDRWWREAMRAQAEVDRLNEGRRANS